MRAIVTLLIFVSCWGGCRRAEAQDARFQIGSGWSVESRQARSEAPRPASHWYACYVKVDLEDGSSRCGSGTPVWCEGGKTLILTNAHVVRKDTADRPISVGTWKGWKSARYVEGSAISDFGATIRVHGPDLCLLEIDAELGAVKIADSKPSRGESCGHFGFGGRSFDSGPLYRGGSVVANDLGKDYLRFSGSSVQGDSGAGIFNSAGELVGVVWGEHYGVTLDEIDLFCSSSESVRGRFPRFFERLREARSARAAQKLPAYRSPSAPSAPSCPNGQCPIR